MNPRKINRLFDAARREPPPAPPTDFDVRVLRAVRREGTPAPFSILEQLNLLFPRLACAAVVVIGLCVATDLVASATLPSLSDGVAQISSHWLLEPNGL